MHAEKSCENRLLGVDSHLPFLSRRCFSSPLSKLTSNTLARVKQTEVNIYDTEQMKQRNATYWVCCM